MIFGFQGIRNSYNDYATDKFMKRLKIKGEKLPLINSENVAKSLINKEIDFGVIAIKNNIAGVVEESENVYDEVARQKVYIKGKLWKGKLYRTLTKYLTKKLRII